MAPNAYIRLCPALLTPGGVCEDETCTMDHDLKFCEPCGLPFAPEASYYGHLEGKDHLMATNSYWLACTVCAIGTTRPAWDDHIRTQSHIKKSSRCGVPVDHPPQSVTTVPAHNYCEVCRKSMPKSAWDNHLRGKAHARRRLVVTALSKIEQVEKAKKGVSISHGDGVDFGVVDSAPGQTYVERVIDINIAASAIGAKYITSNVIKSPRVMGSQAFFVSLQQKSDEGVRIPIRFNPTGLHIGRYEARVELLFENEAREKLFTIIRHLRATVGNPEDHDALRASAPYVSPFRGKRALIEEIIPGERPPRLARHPYVRKLGKAPIPERLVDALKGGSREATAVVSRIPVELNPVKFNQKTYVTTMKTRLWVEEYQADRDMRMYDMSGVQLSKRGANYYLKVPGLAENRPSVMIGDAILVQAQGAAEGRWFEGVVHDVQLEEVGMRFARSFPAYVPGRKFSARFQFNRFPLRRIHQALNQPFKDGRVFFPVQAHVRPPTIPTNKTLDLHNPDVGSNPEQLFAVQCILHLPPGAHPFVVYGPPGTGKTVTVVEAILQILRADADARVFACAPSNSAADVVATRLLAANVLGRDQLFRFCAPSRLKKTIPEAVLPYTNLEGDVFVVPDKNKVVPFRVVITTCSSASFSYNIGVSNGHFSHIFIDEAGQAAEPELMVPIKTMANVNTRIILSGDPQQLGPVIRSPVAKELGLGKSYLERLMERESYDEVTGRGRTLVKLLRNFRSHSQILKFPNEQFYRGELQPCGRSDIVNSFTQWKELPTLGYPVIFHDVCGKDEREATSPSYFNIDEIIQVKEYVKLLLNSEESGIPITEEHIGVITPYYAQATKIRKILRETGIAPTLRVASVELFQGDERRVIIMSTVRSTPDLLAHDLRHALGFVSNRRRFNVAVTRAQALLIIVGNSAVLGLDPLWRRFLNFIALSGGWRGSTGDGSVCGPSWDTSAEVHDQDSADWITAMQEKGINELREMMERVGIQTEDGDPNVDVAQTEQME